MLPFDPMRLEADSLVWRAGRLFRHVDFERERVTRVTRTERWRVGPAIRVAPATPVSETLLMLAQANVNLAQEVATAPMEDALLEYVNRTVHVMRIMNDRTVLRACRPFLQVLLDHTDYLNDLRLSFSYKSQVEEVSVLRSLVMTTECADMIVVMRSWVEWMQKRGGEEGEGEGRYIRPRITGQEVVDFGILSGMVRGRLTTGMVERSGRSNPA